MLLLVRHLLLLAWHLFLVASYSVKPVHGSEGATPDPKRVRIEEESTNVERRVQATAVGEDTYYHMDHFFNEKMMAWEDEDEEG